MNQSREGDSSFITSADLRAQNAYLKSDFQSLSDVRSKAKPLFVDLSSKVSQMLTARYEKYISARTKLEKEK